MNKTQHAKNNGYCFTCKMQQCPLKNRVQLCYSHCNRQKCLHHSTKPCPSCKEYYPYHNTYQRHLQCKRCENANRRFRERKDFLLHCKWFNTKRNGWSHQEIAQYKLKHNLYTRKPSKRLRKNENENKPDTFKRTKLTTENDKRLNNACAKNQQLNQNIKHSIQGLELCKIVPKSMIHETNQSKYDSIQQGEQWNNNAARKLTPKSIVHKGDTNVTTSHSQSKSITSQPAVCIPKVSKKNVHAMQHNGLTDEMKSSSQKKNIVKNSWANTLMSAQEWRQFLSEDLQQEEEFLSPLDYHLLVNQQLADDAISHQNFLIELLNSPKSHHSKKPKAVLPQMEFDFSFDDNYILAPNGIHCANPNIQLHRSTSNNSYFEEKHTIGA